MIDIASLRAMAAAGATVEVILAAIEADQKTSTEKLVARRAKDAERQRRKRSVHNGHAESRGPSDDVCDTTAHIDSTLTKDSIKKVSKKVYLCADIPEHPPEAAILFAKDEGGWLLERTLREWQRFRDYQISKNKKHNSFVALLASWRNWVRSPFQSHGDAVLPRPPPGEERKWEPPQGAQSLDEIRATYGKPNGQDLRETVRSDAAGDENRPDQRQKLRLSG